jgi:hypothetical protein
LLLSLAGLFLPATPTLKFMCADAHEEGNQTFAEGAALARRKGFPHNFCFAKITR